MFLFEHDWNYINYAKHYLESYYFFFYVSQHHPNFLIIMIKYLTLIEGRNSYQMFTLTVLLFQDSLEYKLCYWGFWLSSSLLMRDCPCTVHLRWRLFVDILLFMQISWFPFVINQQMHGSVLIKYKLRELWMQLILVPYYRVFFLLDPPPP